MGARVNLADVVAEDGVHRECSRGPEPVRDGAAEGAARGARERVMPVPLRPLRPDSVGHPRTAIPDALVCRSAAGGETEVERRPLRRRGGTEELWALAARVLAQVQGNRLEHGRIGPTSWVLGGWRFRPAFPAGGSYGAVPAITRTVAGRAVARGEPSRAQSGPDGNLDRTEPEALRRGRQGV